MSTVPFTHPHLSCGGVGRFRAAEGADPAGPEAAPHRHRRHPDGFCCFVPCGRPPDGVEFQAREFL